MLIKNGIAVSMDGKGAWRDNIFVDLRGYYSVSEARASSLYGKTPDQSLLRLAATPHRGRGSTYRRGKTVQTTETTSKFLH